MLPLALLFALLIGVSLGLLGGGGSILTVPILRYVVGMEGHSAIATSLLVVGATSLAGLVVHAKRGRVQWRTGMIFGAAGMLGAFLAGRVAHHLPAAALLLAFSLVMLATAGAMLHSERRAPRASRRPPRPRPGARLPWMKVLVEGLVVGAVTGLVGAGGGFLVVPALVLLARLPMDVAIGTSLLVISLKSFAGFAGYAGHTSLDWPLATSISAVAVAGSFAGAWLGGRLQAQTLRQVFGWFVVAMAFFISAREAPPLFGREGSLLFALLVSAAGTLLFAAARRLVAGRGSRGRRSGPPQGTASARPPGRLGAPLERETP